MKQAQAPIRPKRGVTIKRAGYVDIGWRGALVFNFPDHEPWDAPTNLCALDVADEGGTTLERGADEMNLTKERIRQLINREVAKVGPLFEDESD